MSETKTIPARGEIPVEQTWDTYSIYPSDEAWEAACQTLTELLPKLSGYRGRLGEGPQVILEYLEMLETCAKLLGKIFVYASSFYAVDTTDQSAAAKAGQARGFFARFGAANAFADPELMVIGFERLRQWMQKEPKLTFFKHYVERLEEQQAHVRSGEVEKVLALAGDPLGQHVSTYGALTGADLKFKRAKDKDGHKLEVGQSSIDGLITHEDRKVRKTAWKSYADGYLAYKNTFASTLTGAIKRDVFTMRTRKHETTLHASLSPNNIPVEVFHNLIDVFKKNLPTWHRYWALRRKALGYKKLHVYDIKAPLTQEKPHVPYEQAVAWICEGMQPLGDEYVDVMRRGCLEERWVDRARNKGKRDGAFSSGSQGTYPFIMMSYADDLFSLSTLAHELGHSMHSYYAWQAQPFIYGRYSLFVAEVASNFNQALVRDHLFRTQTDPAFQIALIEEAMSNYHRYFFIMPTLARFELEIHQRTEKGAPLTADILSGLTADLFKEGYGDEVEFDRDRIGITWAQFVHMYMNFYVYQYATGISGANALAKGVLDGNDGAAEKYLGFLRAGGSAYPLDALKAAGVDLAAPEPVETAFSLLAEYVDRLEVLLEK